MDVGLHMIDAHLSNDQGEGRLVGYYAWNDRAGDSELDGPGKRIGEVQRLSPD